MSEKELPADDVALSLAADLDDNARYMYDGHDPDKLVAAAAELRRQHAEIERLRKLECDWAALSQDDGKAQREIERLREHAVTLAEAARQVERERCAEICHAVCTGDSGQYGDGYNTGAWDCEQAIRKG